MRWPAGATSGGVACGIKGEGIPDLGLLVFEEPVSWAGAFTRNSAAAAPVHWCRGLLGNRARAVIVNSGNANACTGAAGWKAVTAVADLVSSRLGCAPDEVLVCSTGPIGVQLPVLRIAAAMGELAGGLGDDPEGFAGALITTDTAIKTASHDRPDIVGVAKGAAMVAPNMATMLAYLVTDAPVGAEDLQSALGDVVEQTFNRISIDACESTNDTVLLFSTGRGQEVAPDRFRQALQEVCGSLAHQIVADAEGGTRVVRTVVSGARSEDAAAALGKAVAASDLWRSAVHGSDPNWGRIVSALGQADRSLDLAAVSVSIGGEVLFSEGEPGGSMAAAAKEMKEGEFELHCVVGEGPGKAVILSSDLSPDYVHLNAWSST